MSHRRFHPALLVLAALVPGTASAKPPSPANSSWPPFIVVCPSGDMSVVVVARDLANNPLPGEPVEIDWCDSCATIIAPCTPDTGGGLEHLSDCHVRAWTDDWGTVVFRLHAGGPCPAGVLLVAGDLPFGRLPVMSPDQNGDGQVDAFDRAAWESAALVQDPRGDLDGSGVVDAADEVILDHHAGHGCTATVPVAHRTWGTLKVQYR